MGVLSLGIKTLLKKTHFFCKTTMEMWREQGRISEIESMNKVAHRIGQKGVPAVWRHTELCLDFFFFSLLHAAFRHIHRLPGGEWGGWRVRLLTAGSSLSPQLSWRASSYQKIKFWSALIWCTSRDFVPASEKLSDKGRCQRIWFTIFQGRLPIPA